MNVKKFVLILCMIIAIGGGFILGWAVKPDAPNLTTTLQTTPTPSMGTETDVQSVDKVGENRILPTTKVKWHIRFSGCPDEFDYEGTAGIDSGPDITGMSKKEIEKAYEHCTVLSLSGEEASIDIMINGYCPKHYLLKTDEDDNILVYKRDEVTYQQRILMVLPLSVEDFSLDVQEEFKDGWLFDSLEEVNAYIEGLDT